MKLYRCESYLVCNIYEESSASTPTIKLKEYPVRRETPKGYWIYANLNERWVAKEGKKKFAHTTAEAAYKCFIYRRKRQNQFLKSTMHYNEIFIAKVQKLLGDLDKQPA